jgi:hypothetical protein
MKHRTMTNEIVAAAADGIPFEDRKKKKVDTTPPTEKQEKFAKVYVETGSPIKALTEAYPDNVGKYRNQDAWKLLRNPKIRDLIEQIQQDCRAKFVTLAPEMLEALEDMARSADSEKVRLQAIIEILDRSGLKPPEKVELSALGVFGSASVSDIKQMVKEGIEGAILTDGKSNSN